MAVWNILWCLTTFFAFINAKSTVEYCSTFQIDTDSNYIKIQASNSDVVYEKGEAIYFAEIFNYNIDDKKITLDIYQEGEIMYKFPIADLIKIMNNPGHVMSDNYLSLRFWDCVSCADIHKLVCNDNCK